jgi:multidrug efflux system outer membrane protein
MNARFAFALAAVLSLAACTSPLGPQGSGISIAGAWTRLWSSDEEGDTERADMPLAGSDQVAVEQRWWQSFGDPVLDRLIGDALANNKSLKLAEARVAEARAERKGATAELFPEIAATGSALRGNQGLTSQNRPIGIKEADLQASWELDLFGKNQARTAAAAAILQSEEARRQAVLVALLAEVARNYFELRNNQEQVAITRRNLDNQQRTLDLIRSQQAGALSSGLDVSRAAAQVATTAAQLPSLRAAADANLNRLSVLLGTVPGSQDVWIAPARPLEPLKPRILIAAPATVLATRPDVRAAERSFAASRSSLEAASKEIYPTVSLTALFGVQDSTLFSGATPWTIGAGLVQPLLNFGRIQARTDAADARQQQAFLAYQQTVLEALEDMEDAITLYLNETTRQRALADAAAQDQRAVALADQQYKAGYSGLLDLLVAQRDELAAESGLAASNALLRENLVRIYTAAGGGWES